MESKKSNSDTILILNNNEALVLLDWLTRFNQKEIPTLFEDQAEERVLYDLEAIIEEVVSETFNEDYKTTLLQARDKVRDQR